MSRLIDDLLSLSRIEMDKHVRPIAQLDLAGVIADVRKTLAMRLEADERQLLDRARAARCHWSSPIATRCCRCCTILFRTH